MNRILHLIVLATLVASPSLTSCCFASIETTCDSQSMIDQISSGSDQGPARGPQRPRVEQGNEAPLGLPSSIAPVSFGSNASGLTAALLKTSFEVQLSPNHKVYVKTCIQWPIAPLWEILKVPIVA